MNTADTLENTVLRIGVCDDMEEDRTAIVHAIKDFFKLTNRYTVEIHEFENGLALIEAYRKAQQFDILLLDILMEHCNGLETAAYIRDHNPQVIIIFLTISPEYAIESYAVDAFYYLLKTAAKEKLYEVLQKSLINLDKGEEPKITLKTADGLELVYCHEIEFVEVFGRKIMYHLSSGQTVETTNTFKNVEEELLSFPKFCKIHRCIIVNAAYVTHYSPKNVRTPHSPNLPVAKTASKELKTKLLL